MSFWFQNLNPEQVEAVSHNEGPLLILAGAGSGKTTVLVSRTGRLIAEKLTTPERICVLTFTNKAAQELKTRVVHKLGDSARKVWTGTFHGFGLQFLKEHWKEADLPKKFGIIDGNDGLAILKELVRDHRDYEKAQLNIDVLMNKISYIRQYGKDEHHDTTPESAASVILAPKFSRRMRELGVVDFEELLLRPLKLLQTNTLIRQKYQDRFDYLMVDEFQDTNSTQMKLIDHLIGSKRNIAVVGDDDQSIYGWRGAEIQNILGFPNRYQECRVIRLERNYRSSEKILNLANAIIASNKNRHTKVLRPGRELKEGEQPELFVFENEEMEIDQVVRELQSFHEKGYRWRDMAVLYRSNSQGGLLEGGFRHAQIPYKLTGGTALFDRKEAKDVLAFIRSSIYPTEVSFRRIINLPARGIGEKTLEAIEAVSDSPLDFHQKARLWAKNNTLDKASDAVNLVFEFLEDLKTQLVSSPDSAEMVLDRELVKLGYRHYVNQSYRDLKVADARWLSVTILGRILDGMFGRHGRTMGTLEMFIDFMELRDPVEAHGDQEDEVQMMTLHACKGLEFPLVFLLGLEEDLLPHARLGQNVDEERRLFYVGVTRAQKHLILTRVRFRKRYGRLVGVAPSRFLLELDKTLFTELNEGRPLLIEERATAIADLLKKLDKRIDEKKIDTSN